MTEVSEKATISDHQPSRKAGRGHNTETALLYNCGWRRWGLLRDLPQRCPGTQSVLSQPAQEGAWPRAGLGCRGHRTGPVPVFLRGSLLGKVSKALNSIRQ